LAQNGLTNLLLYCIVRYYHGYCDTVNHKSKQMSPNLRTIPACIDIIKKLEAQHSNWTPDTLISNLRFNAGYETDKYRKLLNTKPSQEVLPGSKVTKTEMEYLNNSLSHGHEKGNYSAETGICRDTWTNRQITLGHVIVGISAAIHHPNPLFNVNIPNFSFNIPTPFSWTFAAKAVKIDSLFALTITGDLAQTGLLPDKLRRETPCPWGGVGTAASSAELHGDIDGFMLGLWLCTSPDANPIGQNSHRTNMVQNTCANIMSGKAKGPLLSTILEEYYGVVKNPNRKLKMIAGSGYPLESARRFFNFNLTFQHLKYEFLCQTIAFDTAYAPAMLKSSPNWVNVWLVLADFENWCHKGGDESIATSFEPDEDTLVGFLSDCQDPSEVASIDDSLETYDINEALAAIC
jgi:hypothetical protein